jgi:hypothetical protein
VVSPSLRKPFYIIAGLLIVLAAGYASARHYLAPIVGEWIAGPAFNRMISQAVSHALKVDGKFGPMSLGPDLHVTTTGFESNGWPGQAIGALNTKQATAKFSPWAVLRGCWQIDLINIAQADFRIVTPNDALKKSDPQPGPKPWYASLMPQQFFCRWIECPDMQVELPFGNKFVRGENLHVGAMMIGKNFKYFGRNGTLHYPEYSPMAVDAMQVYVTREIIDIGYLYLREPHSPHSNLNLAARLGQHADRSIKARAEAEQLNSQPFLPEHIAAILHGKLSGHVTYETDASGGNASGSGSISLHDAGLHNWEYLDHIAQRSGNPDFRQMNFEQVTLNYSMAGNFVTVDNLTIKGQQHLDVEGRGSWNLATSAATASVALRRVPVGACLPLKIAGSMRGELSGHANWSWHGTKLGSGIGGGELNVTGGELNGFKFQKFISRFLKNDSYLLLRLDSARCSWQQDKEGLHLRDLDVIAPGKAGLRGQIHLASDGKLSGTVMAGLPATSLGWLPDATKTVFSKYADGLYWCSIELSGTEAKPQNNFTAQVLRQLEKHPTAMAELTLRGLSWWVGDILRGQEG